MSELKPCPFCGGEARIKHYCCPDYLQNIFGVECDNCGASGRQFREISFNPADDEKKAIEAWNRRADK